ncbi:amino acid ABC transporter permease [Jannaschia rubra]|uniref:Putative glutamine ABC transporter permease protein GlnM n=1 Tax=Jannaschia rubra TaxID=282197 RepID=A0A0M6XQ88_9RHOB|nr:ABC transporter permease subunit [Jannaschia rubra]CTQ32321.1 putative glutamine ABC transporter permease protein GlnM [Jannaschia rubra]SFG47180.1 L-glutamine ABC transporter membrane protein /L-glutamate ABC transporter membrane protein /L-aspartate ABC transporter membrane protein /L-asparagine ABC transporter membrane protein [Jannaschia rubra]
MTTMTGPPRADGFRIGKLLTDTRYRSYTFQAIAVVLLIVFFGWLVSNAIRNPVLQQSGIDFGFLSEPAGYEISQQPIPYTPQSSHLRAAVIGAINTLIVALLACVTATVLGVIAGILRLSNNWVIRKLMSVYVEIFRNIPVLIWILIFMTLSVNVFPPPSAFRGDDPDATPVLGLMAVTNRGIYFPRPYFTNGIGQVPDAPAADGDDTAPEAQEVASSANWLIVLAVLAGSFFAVRAVNNWATVRQNATGLRPTTWWMTLALWVVPLALTLFLLGLRWDVPELRGFNFQGGILARNSLIALWFALSVYTGAFIAENVRAGILAISSGQTEAAAALGLRPRRIMGLVVLPQALRIIIPPLISQYLNITKNTSLAIVVGYMDLTATLGGITLNQTGRALECILLLMAFYLTFSLVISAVMNAYNASVALKER